METAVYFLAWYAITGVVVAVFFAVAMDIEVQWQGRELKHPVLAGMLFLSFVWPVALLKWILAPLRRRD